MGIHGNMGVYMDAHEPQGVLKFKDTRPSNYPHDSHQEIKILYSWSSNLFVIHSSYHGQLG